MLGKNVIDVSQMLKKNVYEAISDIRLSFKSVIIPNLQMLVIVLRLTFL